jgi:sporulation integral membrane protein YtvI
MVASISQWGFSQATSFLNSIPSILINTLFMVLFSFFISLNFDHVREFFINQLPVGGVELGRKLRSLTKFTFVKYLKSYLIIMGITFCELVIGFHILGVNNPFIVAAAIAVFDFLPVLGAGSVLFVWMVVEAILGNFTFALGMSVLWVIVTVVRNIIEPKIVGKKFGVNPVAVLAAIYLGFRFFGAVGMFVVPIIVQMFYVFHKNGLIKLYKEKPKIVIEPDIEEEIVEDETAEGEMDEGETDESETAVRKTKKGNSRQVK